MANQDMLVYDPLRAADACVIWMHGLGADAHDFVGIIEQLNLPTNHGVRFIFPNAPFKKITVNQGMRMRAWFDIYDFNTLGKEDLAGVQDSDHIISKIIADQEAQGIPSNKIILAGFSQGAAMSLYTGLLYPKTLGGIIALSGFLPVVDIFAMQPARTNKNLPIFMAHGMFDPIVTYNAGQMTCQLLQTQGYQVEWHAYPMEHTVCPDEIQAIGIFLNRCLDHAHSYN